MKNVLKWTLPGLLVLMLDRLVKVYFMAIIIVIRVGSEE